MHHFRDTVEQKENTEALDGSVLHRQKQYF
jgi:hypothetical protein